MTQKVTVSPSSWLARSLTYLRFWAFLMGVGSLLIAYVYLQYHPVYYNRSMESFFPGTDERLHSYRLSRQWFASEHNLLVVYRDPELWTATGMDRQQKLAKALESCAGGHRVVALATSPLPNNPFQNVGEAVRQAASEAEVERIRSLILRTRLYAGTVIARDARTAAVVVQLHRDLGTPEQAGAKLEAIRSKAREVMQAEQVPHLEGPYTAGTLLMIHDVYEYTAEDGRRLQFYSVLLMSIVIAGAFVFPEIREWWQRWRNGESDIFPRLVNLLASLRWLILPFLVIYSALTWSEAIWSWLHGEMTMVGSAISSLVAIIGVTSVVHLGLHYRELRGLMDSQTALVQTLQYLGPAIFWVLLTTAGGFASLLVCQIKPVYDFGTIMTLATVLIGVALVLFFPLTAIGWGNRPIQHGRLEPLTQYWLLRLLIAIDRYPMVCGAVILLPGLVLALGILRLQPQTDFTNNFRPETEVYRAYRFIEDHYGGLGQLDLILDTPDLLALSNQELKDYVDRLRRLEDKLTEIRIETEQGERVYGLSKAVSIPEFYSFFDEIPLLGQMLTPRARLRLLAGDIDSARQELVPVARALLGKFSRYVEANAVLPAFWNRDERKLRIVLQARERLSTWAKRDLLRQIESCCREELGNAAEFRITGIYLMLAGLIESVLRDQAYTTVVALGCMFSMALLAFRSLKLAAIAMVPTVLPVLAVVGTMGWIGLPVNIATAMLASVAMGMTIDSSILYLYRLREEQAAGRSFAEALVRTHGSTGAALMVASVALVLGFSVLTQSRFLPLVHFGLLAALALLGGVIGNLVLLPLLLRWTHRRDWQEVGAVALRRASTGLWLSSDNQPAALSTSDVSAPTAND